MLVSTNLGIIGVVLGAAVLWLGILVFGGDTTGNWVPKNPATGVAFGQTHNAEFNFFGRLTSPVFAAATLGDLGNWAAHHVDGLVVAPLGSLSASPFAIVDYGSQRFGIWKAAKIAVGI